MDGSDGWSLPYTQLIVTVIATTYGVLPGQVLYVIQAYEGVDPVFVPIFQMGKLKLRGSC